MALTWNRSSKTFGYDYYQFWVVGREIGKPGANIYSDAWRQDAGERYWQLAHQPQAPGVFRVASDTRRVLVTTSSPMLYWIFGVFSSENYAHCLLVYQLIEL